MGENKDLLTVTLVALVALSGLLLGGSPEGAVSAGNLESITADSELGWSLGVQAAEMAQSGVEEQTDECSMACFDLCPTSKGWNAQGYQTSGDMNCHDLCKTRCIRVLSSAYQDNYGGN